MKNRLKILFDVHVVIFTWIMLLVLASSCTSTKNTAGTRWYHSFNTRFNVYFNGETAFQDAYKSQTEGYKDNYSEQILMFPVSSLPKDKSKDGGPFDRAIEKAVKSIKTHSIQTKPEAKPAKRNDPKYKEWMGRTEYNPFLHKAWMLMAKSQFYNGDFLTAASTFSYIARLYKTQPNIAVDAQIWTARCYTEIDWLYEAESILFQTKRDGIPDRLQDWYATVYADLLIKQKSYRDAIPYMQTAIRAEKNKLQKNREKYLLGQLYTTLDEKNAAYRIFGEVARASVPYPLSFSAQIRQTEVYEGADTAKVIKKLRRMTKSPKNKDYLDQVYYAMGNVYLALPDTAKAIDAYEQGVKESILQGRDKALNQIRLGDIYFEQRKFLNAQPNYAEALPQLKKEDEAYPRVSKRAAVLDGLVVHVEAVNLQDSLQRLSKMTEEERLEVVNQLIAELLKKEEEERKNKDREDYMAAQEEMRSELNQGLSRPKNQVTAPTQANESSFYFYNAQTVANGKNTFQQKWGRRKLEDDWRRRNKTNPMMTAPDTPEDDATLAAADTAAVNSDALADQAPADSAAVELSTDPHDPQFYLQQIPITEEDLAASDLIIADGLYNMAVIYKDGLEDYPLAMETFAELERRFPDHEKRLEAYHHIFLMYWREGDTIMSANYKQKIRTEFPESDLAIAMSDPDYEYNLKLMTQLQESLYQATYQAYLDGNIKQVRENYQTAASKYTQSELMPKFLFLNALTYVSEQDAENFKKDLQQLIEKYPQSDVALLAAEMMKGFQRGLILSASGDNMLARGSLFNMQWLADGEMAEVDSIPFIINPVSPHEILVIYPQGSINDNLLLYTVASFNFGNFVRRDFDLERSYLGRIGMLQIKGFHNYDESQQYLTMIYDENGYAADLDRAVVVVPISTENYAVMLRGKSLEDYMQFFEENFSEGNQNLFARWESSQKYELEIAATDSITPSDAINQTASDSIAISQTPTTLPTDSISQRNTITNPADTLTAQQRLEQQAADLADNAQDLFNEGQELADKLNKNINEFAEDPIRGTIKFFQNLFTKKPKNAIDEYVQQQEKAEKERLKAEKKAQKAKAKADKERLKQEKKNSD
ncbi:MAG: hypothetical protein LBR66_09525 [Candidatus Symbiothrix sp.]|nr:hypothetical protein [Candidatus Symbiothrix sp.]